MTQTIESLQRGLNNWIPPTTLQEPVNNACFTGSGDSLASSYAATRYGHLALSAGDIEWMEELPRGRNTIVGISNSGTSGATIRALRRARRAGLKTVAITSQPESPMGEENPTVLIPPLIIDETIPVSGHLVLALGVAATLSLDAELIRDMVITGMKAVPELVDSILSALPETTPHSCGVLSLPELRSAGNFWSLKIIEATGVATRDVPLEECGHVDYFVGPQSHVTFSVIGRAGRDRFSRLQQALVHAGHRVISADLLSILPDATSNQNERDYARDLLAAVVGTFVAKDAATRWQRPPFRGGAVNMDAAHIKIEI